MFYVQNDQEKKAEGLAQLADYLEECYAWDISFDSETV